MADKKDIERIRLDLKEKGAKKFRYIKEQRGIKFNTVMVQVLLTEEFKRLGGKEELL